MDGLHHAPMISVGKVDTASFGTDIRTIASQNGSANVPRREGRVVAQAGWLPLAEHQSSKHTRWTRQADTVMELVHHLERGVGERVILMSLLYLA